MINHKFFQLYLLYITVRVFYIVIISLLYLIIKYNKLITLLTVILYKYKMNISYFKM